MKIYIDFDYTLFDTYKFRQELYKLLNKNNLSNDLLKNTAEKSKKDGGKTLNLKNTFKKICEDYGLNCKIVMDELQQIIDKCKTFLYDDSLEFLEYLKTTHNEVFLLTWGDEEFQMEKIIKSDIQEYFNEIICTEELKYTLKLDYKNSIFIDDSLKDLKGFYDNGAYKVIRIRRENGKNSDKELEINDIEEYKYLKDINKDIFERMI